MTDNGNSPGSVAQLAGLIQGAIDQFVDEFPDNPGRDGPRGVGGRDGGLPGLMRVPP